MRRPEIVERIKRALQEVAPTAMAILYGSEARGDARPDSDIDLLVLTDSNNYDYQEELEIRSPLYDIEIDTGIPVNITVMPRTKWFDRPFKTPFSVNVNNEGIIL